MSDDFFNLCDAPARVAIVGGGYIAVEFAGVLQALGSKVEMFVRGSRLLDAFDVELSDELAENLRQHGIHCTSPIRVAAIEQIDEKRLGVIDDSGRAGEAFRQRDLRHRRRPNSDRARPGRDRRIASMASGSSWSMHCRTPALANVHAVGDISSRLALTPVAIAAARG